MSMTGMTQNSKDKGRSETARDPVPAHPEAIFHLRFLLEATNSLADGGYDLSMGFHRNSSLLGPDENGL